LLITQFIRERYGNRLKNILVLSLLSTTFAKVLTLSTGRYNRDVEKRSLSVPDDLFVGDGAHRNIVFCSLFLQQHNSV
jgi:hypothetical protein